MTPVRCLASLLCGLFLALPSSAQETGSHKLP